MNHKKIGVFDSGLGGLTTVRELKRILPNEDIVYFGDTGRVPYGNKSKDTILRYANQAVDFLKNLDCKLIIAACGTVSAVAPDSLEKNAGVKLFRVLKPAAQAACATTSSNIIGVIGTSATIRSAAYGKAIRMINPNAKVIGKACPMFVPLVENGYSLKDNQVARLIAQEYLLPLKDEKIDTLILGCTHYPLLYDLINDIMNYEVNLIDSGAVTARAAMGYLVEHSLLNPSASKGSCEFFVSDDTKSFGNNASLFLGSDINGSVKSVCME